MRKSLLAYLSLVFLLPAMVSCSREPADTEVIIDYQLRPMDRIGIRRNDGKPEFFNTVTGETFHPIGSSYIRLHVKEDGNVFHANFAEGKYDRNAAESALQQMRKSKYNILRVWLYHGSPSLQPIRSIEGPLDTDVPDLYQPYMDNFLDFLERATGNRIYIQLAIDRTPQNRFYLDMVNDGYPDVSGIIHREYMVPSAIEAKEMYIDRIMEAIKEHNPDLLSTIFAFEIRNELHSTTGDAPFNSNKGIVRTAAGEYDMGNPESRQACQDDNMALYLNRSAARIKKHDPDALTTTSIFTFAPVGKVGLEGKGLLPINTKDKRWPARPKVLLGTDIDFIDIHNYYPWDWKEGLESSGWSELDKTKKPFVAGEFGAHRKDVPDVRVAGGILYDYRQDILSSGFQGAYLFTWDEVQHTRWTMQESGGIIREKLKPENIRWDFQE